jgi:hypothetical protein
MFAWNFFSVELGVVGTVDEHVGVSALSGGNKELALGQRDPGDIGNRFKPLLDLIGLDRFGFGNQNVDDEIDGFGPGIRDLERRPRDITKVVSFSDAEIFDQHVTEVGANSRGWPRCWRRLWLGRKSNGAGEEDGRDEER